MKYIVAFEVLNEVCLMCIVIDVEMSVKIIEIELFKVYVEVFCG